MSASARDGDKNHGNGQTRDWTWPITFAPLSTTRRKVSGARVGPPPAQVMALGPVQGLGSPGRLSAGSRPPAGPQVPAQRGGPGGLLEGRTPRTPRTRQIGYHNRCQAASCARGRGAVSSDAHALFCLPWKLMGANGGANGGQQGVVIHEVP